MTTQEKVLDTLQQLFDDELPEIIRELNRTNDGIMLSDLSGTLFFGGSLRLPYAVLGIKAGEYTEKDRIITNELHEVVIDFTVADSKEKWRHEYRYAQAVRKLVERHRVTEVWDWVTVRKITGGTVVLSVVE